MNMLATDERAKILNCLIEGCSMRSTSRLTGAAKKTVERLLVSAGAACAEYLDKNMRNLPCKVLQVDEIWAFCGCKEANVPEAVKRRGIMGDVWTWVAIDADSKLIPAWYVGKRDSLDANLFIGDLAERLANRVQLTSDGLHCYVEAVEKGFGSEIDFSMLIKLYGKPLGTETRYSPPQCIGARKRAIVGHPDKDLVSTSYVERSNLSMRMGMRRFTRLTNAFSKKVENHRHALAIYFMHYNFCRIHGSLRVTPAMQAGITDHVWEISELVNLMD
jgi:IS1 family transposase